MPIESRPNPRVSANKLAEYMTCSAARRRRIISEAKNPPEFIVPRYNPFYDVAPAFAASRPLDEEIIVSSIEALTGKESQTEWERDNVQLNIDLLQRLLDLPDLLEIEQYDAVATGDRTQSIALEGVEVSVRPELLLRRVVRGQRTLGALKFYLPKTFPLNEESGAFLAALVHLYLEQSFPGENPDNRHCFVMDVPSGVIYNAPRSVIRRRAELAAACEEIAARWSSF